MKTVGLILVSCFPIIIGFEFRRYAKISLDNIKETLNFMIFIREEIRFSSREISEIFALSKAQQKIKPELITAFWNVFFKKSLNEKELKRLNFKGSEIELLSLFFKGLGTNDIDGQIRHCDYYIELIRKKINEYNKDFLNTSKVYLGLGFAAASALIIFLI